MIETMLEYLVCPQCRGDLRYTKEQLLVCVPCRLCFPIENNVPELNLKAAMTLTAEGKVVPRKTSAVFTLESGEEAGLEIRLELGTCKAIGRRLDDGMQTQTFNIDFTMTLDEPTKKIIKTYFSKQKGKEEETDAGELGFRRLPDLILNDAGVSRLHAMIFHHQKGAGILDLVSRNGTFVNGKEIEAAYLKAEDKIQIGTTTIRFSPL